MTTELIPIKLDKITQTRSYSMIVLKAKNGHRFAIYADPQVGRVMQMYLTGTHKPRPLTHELLAGLFKGLNVRCKQVVINDVEETTYFARLFVEQQMGEQTNIVEIDARPSDSLALALLNNIPLYCTLKVIEKTANVLDE